MNGIHEVRGSTPLSSTTPSRRPRASSGAFVVRGPRGARRKTARAGRLVGPARTLALGLAVLLLATTALPGCMVGRFTDGNPVPLERVERIRPGETTKQEVLAWFGPPQNYSNATLIEQLLASDEVPPGAIPPYRFSDVLAYQMHEGRVRGVLLLLFNYVELHVSSDHLVVFFDDEDRVLYYGVHRLGQDAP